MFVTHQYKLSFYELHYKGAEWHCMALPDHGSDYVRSLGVKG